MTLYKWSQTASADASSDPTINWAEGQAPSSINDSARAMMAAIAKYRDDIAGAVVTSGTSMAYAVSTFQAFDTFAHLNGQMVAFSPHTTNGATVTLNVDGLGAKPLRTSPGVELLAGMIIQGTPYTALYNNNDGAFYLQGFFGNPYSIPILGGMDYWDTVAPNSSFIFPQGQAISRTTYAAAFARWGTKFGAGDGSTTFNVPDKTGRVSAMIESVATRLTQNTGGFAADSTKLGSVGGSESHALAAAENGPHQHNVYLRDPGHSHLYTVSVSGPGTGTTPNYFDSAISSSVTGASTTGITIGSVAGVANDNQTTSSGGGNAHLNVQPTITCNYIIRII